MTDPLRRHLEDSLGTAYTITRELGGGGMSRVFLAEETALGRRVVVKVLPPEMVAGVSTERFKREIALAARMQHPHIVPLLSAGELDGVPYFTMPFVEGESLRVRIARHGELPIAEAMRVLREVASALQYAHERGIVHRDIKPDNVLLSGGAAMVTDFGVAKALSASSNAEGTNALAQATSLGIALGTPAYMSPEQASADPAVDHRADIYAFGVMAYEILTGQPPFAGRTPQGLLAAHVTETPEPIQKRRSNLPPALGALVMRCLEKRPSDRPQTAAEIVHALDDITTPSGGMQPTSALPATSGIAPLRANRKTLSRRALLAAGIVFVVAIVGVVTWRARRSSSPPAAAAAPKSIAVLPLVNASGDTSNQYFVDGMTDEITSALARVSGLRVASRSSASSIDTRKSVDIREVAQRLNVGAVLEGRVRKDGSKMRLAMQLTNATDGLSLWSQTYEREVKDAFQVQDDVSRAIASALSVQLASRPSASRGTANPEAHDFVLRARYQMNLYNEQSLRQAVDLLNHAIALDSSYADAWAGLSEAWGRLADEYMPAIDAVPRMRQAAAKAMAIDSANVEVVMELANLRFYYDRDVSQARALYERGLTRDSTNQMAAWFAYLLAIEGQGDSAAAVLRRLARVDPVNRLMLGSATTTLVWAGHPQEAKETCNRAIDVDSMAFRGCRRRIRRAEGKYEEDLAACENAACRATDLGLMGRRVEAEREANRASAEWRGKYVRPLTPAQMWAAVGNADSAMAWLGLSEKYNGAELTFLQVDPLLASLHKDPRFQALLKRVGAPPVK